MYFLSQEFHSVKEENENLRKENRSNVPCIRTLYNCFDASEPTKHNKHTRVENLGEGPKKMEFFHDLHFGVAPPPCPPLMAFFSIQFLPHLFFCNRIM